MVDIKDITYKYKIKYKYGHKLLGTDYRLIQGLLRRIIKSKNMATKLFYHNHLSR